MLTLHTSESMNKSLLILFLSSFLNLFANSQTKTSTYSISTVPSPNGIIRPTTKLKVTFIAPNKQPAKSHVKMLVNKDTVVPKINSKGIYVTYLDTGKYNLKFMVPTWYDVIIDSLKCGENMDVRITINFEAKRNKMPQVLYNLGKPAIYVYPEKPTKINLALNVKGKMTFSYPLYENGWTFTASPLGNIEYKNRNYNYLFWEGEQNLQNLAINWNEGFIVSSDTLISFFENSLARAGLNEKETQDFITFWVPKMQNNKQNYIHFMFTNDYDQLATINIDPKPENLIRVFVLWSNAEYLKALIKPQVFPLCSRKGYTVIEWGGSEMNNILNIIKP